MLALFVVSILRSKLAWLCVILLALGAAGGVAAYQWGYSLGQSAAGTFQPQMVFVPAPAATPDPLQRKVDAVYNPPQPWDGKERLNVLVMGIDQRQGENELGYRTDTMIVLTLDPVTLQAGILSVPRDLWVPIPGFGNARINTANEKGDRYAYPGGGPALAKKTVENLLGIKLQHYVRLNFTAFEDLVDRIGGISVDVPDNINDPTYPTNNYATEVFSITKGIHLLDGATALKYARTRHGATDFDRAKRQQQVIFAVQDKLKDPRVSLALFASASEVLDRLSQSVTTDLNLDQIERLAALAVRVDRKNIKAAVIDENFGEYVDTPDGQNVVVPNRGAIAKLRTDFFSAPVAKP